METGRAPFLEREMARERVKTEMKGTGGGRWCLRTVAKESADRGRRMADGSEADAGYREYLDERDDND